LPGTLLAIYITFEAPFSGMSMNPARSVASAMYANDWSGMWVYLIGPPLGMLLAAGAYRNRVFCAKLNHTGGVPASFAAFWGDGRLTRLGSTAILCLAVPGTITLLLDQSPPATRPLWTV